MGTMIPAAGSALGPPRDPSAESKEPRARGGDADPAGCLPWVGGLRWPPGRKSTSGKDAAEGGDAPAQR